MKIRPPDLAALRRIFRELELVSLYKEVRWKKRMSRTRKRPNYPKSSPGHFGGRPHPRPLPLRRDPRRFAVSERYGGLLFGRADELFSALSSAQEVTVYDLKPIFLAATRRGVDLHPALFDAMLAVYLVNPGRKDYAIESVLSEFIGIDVRGEGKGTRLGRPRSISGS